MLDLIWHGFILKCINYRIDFNMVNFSYYLAILANILLLIVVIFSLSRFRTAKIQTQLIIALIVIGCSIYIPIYMGSNFLWLMRGILGDLSITTTILSFLFLLNIIFRVNLSLLNNKTHLLIALLGFLLYLSTLAILPFDLYDLGFLPNMSFFLIFGIIMLTLWFVNRLIAWVFLASFLAYYFRLHNSINVWDYLIDPVLWLYALGNTVIALFSMYRTHKNART